MVGIVATLVSGTTLLASFESVPRVIGGALLPRDPLPHDVDGDGDLDIFYIDGSESNGTPTEVGWFENTGGGAGWTRHVLESGLRGPAALHVADLNRDGNADLLVGLRIGDGVIWFRGLGDGNFAASAVIKAPLFRVEDVNTADFNRDGRLDVVISSGTGPMVMFAVGRGYADPVPIATVSGLFPEQQRTVALDFDRDGDIDLVTAIGGADRVIFSRNNGNGTFANPVNLGSLEDPYALAAADLDDDGFADVVTGSGGFDDHRVVWFKNLGGGNFSTARVLDSDLRTLTSVAIGDFDRDGDPDIAAAGSGGPLIWFERTAPGVFSARKALADGGGGMRDLSVGDLDGDGDADLLAAQWSSDRFIWHSNNTPPPVVMPPRILSFGADDSSVASNATLRWETSGATSVEISPEIGAVAGLGSRTMALASTTTFTLTARNSAATVTEEVTVVVGEAPLMRDFSTPDDTIGRGQTALLEWDVAGADSLFLEPGPGAVTGDSLEAVITADTTFTLRAVNEFGESTAELAIIAGDPPTFTSLTARPAAIEVNGVSELSWISAGGSVTEVSDVGVIPFGSSIAVRPASSRSYEVTVSNDFGSVTRTVEIVVSGVLLSRTPVEFLGEPYGMLDLELADLNGDGIDDVLVSGRSNDYFLQWSAGTAAGGFGPPAVIQTSPDRLWAPTIHDMDGDRDLDPVIGGDGPMHWFPNPGNGAAFGPRVDLGPSGVFRQFHVGDLNGDGLPDLAGGNGSALRFYPGVPGGGTGTPQLIDEFSGSINFVESTAADIDGDGDLDLVAGKDFDGEVFWFQNNGGLFTSKFPVFSGGERILGIKTLDADGDGDLEVLVQSSGNAFTLINGDHGDFSSATTAVIGSGISGIRDHDLVDLDLDGDLDIVVVGRSVAFIENRGSGQFVMKENFAVQQFNTDPNAMKIYDVDRDGDPDVVVVNNRGSVWIENLYRPAAAPVALNSFPVVSIEEDFGSHVGPLQFYFSDPDTPGLGLSYSLRDLEGEGVVSSIAIQPGIWLLRLRSAADRNGTVQASLRATDPTGLYADLRLTIEVAAVPDAPRLVGSPPDVTADAAGSPVELPVDGWFFDPDDGEVLVYALGGNSNPEILKSLRLGADDGLLSLEFAPYVSGTSQLEVMAIDPTGRSVAREIAVILPDLPAPSLSVSGALQLNRQTGLYEQTFTVTNDGTRAIGGFRLEVAGLPSGATLYNATLSGGNWVDYLTPVAPGGSVVVVLEYQVPGRAGPPDPVVTALPMLPQAAAIGSGGFAIDRCELTGNGEVLIEFTSRPGGRYAVEYTDSEGDWRLSPVPITASTNRTQWLDRGPPWTDRKPDAVKSRLYRVREIPSASEE